MVTGGSACAGPTQRVKMARAMVELFLMSPPSPGWALRGRANFRSREAAPVDALRARREWLSLAEAIEARGGTVVVLPPPSGELSGMPYAAECGHIVDVAGEPPRFLLPRMSAPHRRGEREPWAALAVKLGLEPIELAEGLWEAQGDVADFDSATLLFFGGRTDSAGMEAAARFLPGELVRLELREPAFHGNMAVLPLPAVDRLAVCADVLVGDGMERLLRRFGRERIVPVSEDEIRCYATNGLPIARSVLVPSVTPPRVTELLTSLGLEVVSLPMRELCEKAGGAARCLVSRALLAEGRVLIPDDHRLEPTARAIRAE